MSEDKIIESTLSFQLDERLYEAAREHPTYYHVVNREQRSAHPFLMYDDIMQQADLIAGVLDTMPAVARHMAAQIVEHGVQRVMFSGIGGSYHLGMGAAHSMWRLARIPAETMDSGEALLSGPVVEYERTVVVGLSSSGNTIEAVKHLRTARQAGAYTLAFTNLDKTRLTEAAHDSYVPPGGYSFIWDYPTRLVALCILAVELGKALNRPAGPIEAVEAALADLPAQVQHVLDTTPPRCEALGREIDPMRGIVIPAMGNQLPNAWEAAMRFQEMAHFPAYPHPLVDFLHGGISMLAPDVLALLFAPPGDTYDYSLRAARVTQIVKAPCIAIVDEDDAGGVAALADGVVRVPITHPLLKPVLYVIPGAQLLPYYTEIARPDGNPDAQRTDQPRFARAYDVAMPPDTH